MVMSSDSSHATISLHSDASQRHEIVASPPPLIPAIPAIHQENRLTSIPSHRRANTEYIARPPIFEDSGDLSGDERTARPPLSWANTFQRKKFEARAQVLSDWFQGKSDPVDLGIRVRPDGVPDTLAMESPQRQPAVAAQHARKASAPPGSGRFSFFGLRRQVDQPPPDPADDEFLNFDVCAALSLPTSHSHPDEDLDTLRQQATTVIRRMQEAYKQRTFAMHQALADQREKQDELEDTRARIDHFKTQLDGMAAKVLDQERAMQAMAEELEQEKQLRKREQSRSRSRMVRAAPEDEIPSLVLQTPNRGSKRASHGTLTSDSGFESGDESIADSVFSHREGMESPTSAITAPSPSPSLSQVALSTPNAGPTPTQKNLVAATTTPTPTRSSTYDRVMNGLAATRLGSSLVGKSNQTNPCKNCYGVPANEAWSVMGILKDENRGLKTRLSELELVIDDCLSMVGP
ncbi:hypothetical protein N7468_003535 [Penicillium chermesinum]|uniref:Uncharacterized protein n=1 Tax=Penicillium chermesinum TaxID=63820 RepID=A0A9W9P7C0_9EURO|nr:uncharacterized protein N7468_003535 [Penicillium chermesinum]KAJ5238916.1 hypothetical protein N7468_003535 [Penicillium chermesinum]KAJ6164556.1 hypothetical protein N7470_003228 [Penicillium chermesinum]